MARYKLAGDQEFHAVIALGPDDGRMSPLTENLPRWLLPVCNQPVLRYQLNLLERVGFEVSYTGSCRIEVIETEEAIETGEALRLLKGRISRDIILLGSDIISENYLTQLMNVHRCKFSDVTMLLKQVPTRVKSSKTQQEHTATPFSTDHNDMECPDQEDRDLTGLTVDGRVVIKLPMVDLEQEEVELPKSLISSMSGRSNRISAHSSSGLDIAFGVPQSSSTSSNLCFDQFSRQIVGNGALSLRTDLIDVHVYAISNWVINFVANGFESGSASLHGDNDDNDNTNQPTRPQFSSAIRTELLPYIIHRQFLSSEELVRDFPEIVTKNRDLENICSSQYLPQPSELDIENPRVPTPVSATREEVQPTANSRISLKCYAVLVPKSSGVCCKITSLSSYLNINRFLASYSVPIAMQKVVAMQSANKQTLGYNNGTNACCPILSDYNMVRNGHGRRDSVIGNKEKESDTNIPLSSVSLSVREAAASFPWTIETSNRAFHTGVIHPLAVIEEKCRISDCIIDCDVRIGFSSSQPSSVPVVNRQGSGESIPPTEHVKRPKSAKDIAPYSRLVNSVCMRSCVIGIGCVIEGCVLSPGCVIEDGARLIDCFVGPDVTVDKLGKFDCMLPSDIDSGLQGNSAVKAKWGAIMSARFLV